MPPVPVSSAGIPVPAGLEGMTFEIVGNESYTPVIPKTVEKYIKKD